MTYLGGSGTGYESVREPLYVGVASTDKPITEAHEWQASDKPILHIDDKDAQWWENSRNTRVLCIGISRNVLASSS